jgi:hypothetical protein
MTSNLEYIAFKETLMQSEFAGSQYEEFFNQINSTFNNPLFEEVGEIYNQIVETYDYLTEHQVSILNNIMEKLNYVKEKIDPNRLKDFNFTVNNDGDLLLYRKNETGLLNIIIHPDDDFAFSYIGKEDGQKLEFFETENADYEKIVLLFLDK